MISKLRIDKVFDEREMIYALANAWDITSASFWKNYSSYAWHSLIIDHFNISHTPPPGNDSSAESRRVLLDTGGGPAYYQLTMTMAMEFENEESYKSASSFFEGLMGDNTLFESFLVGFEKNSLESSKDFSRDGQGFGRIKVENMVIAGGYEEKSGEGLEAWVWVLISLGIVVVLCGIAGLLVWKKGKKGKGTKGEQLLFWSGSTKGSSVSGGMGTNIEMDSGYVHLEGDEKLEKE